MLSIYINLGHKLKQRRKVLSRPNVIKSVENFSSVIAGFLMAELVTREADDGERKVTQF